MSEVIGYLFTAFFAEAVIVGVYVGIKVYKQDRKIKEVQIRPWKIDIKFED